MEGGESAGYKFLGNVIIKGTIELVTGLHIGGLKETVEIGGTDNPVIYGWIVREDKKIPEKVPIIPGSSLKGKIRALLELKYADKIITKDEYANLEEEEKKKYIKVGDDNYILYESDKAKLIPILFGVGAKEAESTFSKTRLVFRDCTPTEETLAFWDSKENILYGTEIKPENTISRITGMATPRFFERVPAGSKFKFEVILSIYEEDKERIKEMVDLFIEGLRLLEDNYLGGSGSRGYGKIKFDYDKFDITIKTASDYMEKKEGTKVEKIEDLPLELNNLLSNTS